MRSQRTWRFGALLLLLVGCGTDPLAGRFPIDLLSVDASADADSLDGGITNPDADDAGADVASDTGTSPDDVPPPIDVLPPEDADPTDVDPTDTGAPDVPSPPDTGEPDVPMPPDTGEPDAPGPDVLFPPEDCDNGRDDDGDGRVDCRDPECADDPACAPNPVELCNNGIDDDGDGLVDCGDRDCARDPACAPTPEDCFNGRDDDGDGDIDCGDDECAERPGCAGLFEFCANGIDDDADFLVDCDDPDCEGRPACEGGIERCDNGRDDDGDGRTDCDDPDCAGSAECAASGEDACVNRTDLSILPELDYEEVAIECALPCLGAGFECTQSCVRDTTGLSDGCSACFALFTDCLLGSCLAACAVDPGGPACLDCAVEACGDTFNTCSGVDITDGL